MEGMEELCSDAPLQPTTGTSGREVEVTSGADDLNPKGKDRPTERVEKPETSVDSSTPKLLSKKALKRRNQKVRKQALGALSRVSLSQDEGLKEGPSGDLWKSLGLGSRRKERGIS
ncbi:hypothetical protein JTE90_021957 [Oedothorax gibbosus]|uniref:Uncharacterized protein n=1 Tax=Oedothorax gibbosus TaxID=931172 RepID=A0AAV6V529_9ARAC|nr:hypothetical protein JTE90_021957 [Oedothorax gibbosus]